MQVLVASVHARRGVTDQDGPIRALHVAHHRCGVAHVDPIDCLDDVAVFEHHSGNERGAVVREQDTSLRVGDGHDRAEQTIEQIVQSELAHHRVRELEQRLRVGVGELTRGRSEQRGIVATQLRDLSFGTERRPSLHRRVEVHAGNAVTTFVGEQVAAVLPSQGAGDDES